MKFISQKISDLILIKPSLHGDNRGYFVETFRQDLFEKALGYKVDFIQDNESKSSKGVLRGLHYQLPPFCQSKLVRVTEGSILDIVVDIRKSSQTFGQHTSFELSEENMKQLFVPCGFAHGFLVLSENAKVNYKVDNFYMPEFDRGISFIDPELRIEWPYPIEKMQLSNKDKLHPNLFDSSDLFD